MAKRVTEPHIAHWRQLQADGKRIPQIARETGWDARTVHKHLDADIRSAQVREIRRALFQERLGQHWDMLLERVLQDLETAEELTVQKAFDLVSSQELFDSTGVRAQRVSSVDYAVEVKARGSIEWQLLQQHMPKDTLWQAVRHFEESLSEKLASHQGLYEYVAQDLSARLELDVVERVGNAPALSRALTLWATVRAYEQASGQGVAPVSEDQVYESTSGEMKVGELQQAAHAPGRKTDLVKAINQTITECSQTEAARRAIAAERLTSDALADLKRLADYFRLLRYLPGVCEVCARFEV